ncbi:hypothetical protein HYPSUDRAFT_98700, partial [Hypholoma sublateritium FD-334 SS-4]
QVCMHDTSGNKLQACSKIGIWVGFNEESNAHQIYWADKCSIMVKQSVKFTFEDEVTVDAALLEWEISTNIDPNTAVNPNIDNHTPILRCATVEDAADDKDNVSKSQNPTDHIENCFHNNKLAPDRAPIEPQHGSCIWRESEYVHRLHDGTGLSSAHPSDPLIPAGIQEGLDAGGVADDESGGEEDEWEMVEVAEHTMAVVMAGAEGLTPTFEEAWKRADWPK